MCYRNQFFIQLYIMKMQRSLCLWGILCVLFVAVWGAPTSRSRRCQSTQQNIHGCCDGFMWDIDDNDCVKCSPGYTGIGCTIKCSHPLFGENCQKVCSCSPVEFCDFMFGCLKSNEISSTIPRSSVTALKDLNRTDLLEERSTSTILKITDTNIRTIIEHRTQTNWQFMLIITCLLIVLAATYLGRCVHRHCKSRVHQVSNTNTAAQNTSINESHQIEYFYEEIQNVEYEDPERYRTVTCDDNSGNCINTSQEKMDSVSIIPSMSSLEPSTDEAINGHQVSENTMYENQPKIKIRETGDLYLTPTM